MEFSQTPRVVQPVQGQVPHVVQPAQGQVPPAVLDQVPLEDHPIIQQLNQHIKQLNQHIEQLTKQMNEQVGGLQRSLVIERAKRRRVVRQMTAQGPATLGDLQLLQTYQLMANMSTDEEADAVDEADLVDQEEENNDAIKTNSEMTFDLIERDPKKINRYIRVIWDEVFAEPDESSYSLKCLWENSNLCYRFGKNCCYNFLSYIFSVPTSLCWGCTFGVTAFYHVWLFMPLLRLQSIVSHIIRKFISIILYIFLTPIFETLGLILSRIYVQQYNGEPRKPLLERLHTTDYTKSHNFELPITAVMKFNKVAPMKKTPDRGVRK